MQNIIGLAVLSFEGLIKSVAGLERVEGQLRVI